IASSNTVARSTAGPSPRAAHSAGTAAEPSNPADPIARYRPSVAETAAAKGPAEATEASISAESKLQDLLREMIAPESWTDQGTQAQSRVFHGALVVRQTAAAHREIAELIRSLRDTLATAK